MTTNRRMTRIALDDLDSRSVCYGRMMADCTIRVNGTAFRRAVDRLTGTSRKVYICIGHPGTGFARDEWHLVNNGDCDTVILERK